MAHANHLLRDAFEGLEQSVTRSSHVRQTRADALIAEGRLGQGPEAVLFDKEGPIHCDHDPRDDYAQTLATGVFEIRRDRVDWRVHATPDACDALTGTTVV
jgi:hypothetical protein